MFVSSVGQVCGRLLILLNMLVFNLDPFLVVWKWTERTSENMQLFHLLHTLCWARRLTPCPVKTSCRPGSSPHGMGPAPHKWDQRRPWHPCNENTAFFITSLWCALSKPSLLHRPKATIVFVVVIDIVFRPYNTKQSDHDSDANVEVERVFLMSCRVDQKGSGRLHWGNR